MALFFLIWKFMSNHQYIFIIGAAKCGTTALADMLDQSSDICLSYPKEPDYFTDRIYPKGEKWYEACFRDKGCSIRLDSSVSYSAGWAGGSLGIAERIYQFAPNSKIIYLMRDPVDRTWSSYWHSIRNGNKELPFSECIKDESSSHITASLYSGRISEYESVFGKENILLLTQKQLNSDPGAVLKKVGQVIGIDGISSQVSNMGRKVNSSYQFNWFGGLVLKVIPLSFVKRCAHFANRHLPIAVSRSIKAMISKGTSEINNEDAILLKEIYSADLDTVEQKYGIDLKTGRWWM
tara:strand:+ start:1221 stop:2099 length:879 start_codon:yes stop_codon:yes gene_type:complete